MTIVMRPVGCPHNGCDHYGPPTRGRDAVRRSKMVWLCGSCGGPLPIRTPRQEKQLKRRGEWDEVS